MTLSVLVCDDLPEERTNLSRMLRRYAEEKDLALKLETAGDGDELLSLWKPGRWELIFLDIYMPQMDGVTAARRLRKLDTRCEIVFATTSRDHGMEGYELRALDYLTKPFTQGDVNSVLDWFLQKREEKDRGLILRTPEGEERVSLEEILFIESRGHTCVVHALRSELSVRSSIDELAEGLDAAFFRCHKSFLLNFAHVSAVEQRAFRLTDGTSIPISAANLTKSKSALLAWKAEHL